MSSVTARLAAVERAARERRAVLEAPAKVLAAEERRRSESAAAAPALSPAELADLAAGWTAAAERADGEHRLCERIANMARVRAIELEAMERGEWPTEGVAAWENGANLIERAALGPRRRVDGSVSGLSYVLRITVTTMPTAASKPPTPIVSMV